MSFEKMSDSERSRLREVEHKKSVVSYVQKCKDVKELKKRGVWWFVETYLPPGDFEYALSKSSHWAYILHDQDVDDSGEPKEPHYHVLLHYDNARSGSAVLRDFVGYANTFVESCKSSPVVCYEYLTHLNDPGKFQYSSSRIVSDNPVYWEHFIPSVRDRTVTDFLEDLLSTEDFDLVEMAKKYGRDFIKNYRTYVDFRNQVLPFTRRFNLD